VEEIIHQAYIHIGNTRIFHWMIEGRCYEVTYALFARHLRFGRKDANCPKIHMVVCFEAKDIKLMFPRSQRGNVGYSIDLLPFMPT
jgi:hypothetical protein